MQEQQSWEEVSSYQEIVVEMGKEEHLVGATYHEEGTLSVGDYWRAKVDKSQGNTLVLIDTQTGETKLHRSIFKSRVVMGRWKKERQGNKEQDKAQEREEEEVSKSEHLFDSDSPIDEPKPKRRRRVKKQQHGPVFGHGGLRLKKKLKHLSKIGDSA